MDDDTWERAVYLGMGYTSCTAHVVPTKKELRAIRRKQPIGFVHFTKVAKKARKRRKK
jgi:hypothetical protein